MQVATPKKGYKLVKTLFGKYEEIPEEWEHKELDTISKITGGGTPDTTKNEYWDGDIPWAVPTDITNLDGNYIENTQRKITKEGLDRSSSKLLSKNSILLTTRATIGYCAICTEPMATNQGFQNVICNSDVDNLFILYALRFNKNLLISLANGTTFAEISKRNVSRVKIAIPPLPEQQQIASILSNVDDTIQKTDQIIKQTQRLKKGMMQKLLTRGIGHTKFKKIKHNNKMSFEIPDNWHEIKFKKICSIPNKLIDPKEELYKNMAHISSENIERYSGRLNNVNTAAEDEMKSGKFLFDEKHVLYSKIRPNLVKASFPKYRGVCSADIYPIHCNEDKIIPEFLVNYLLSEFFTNIVIRFSGRAQMPKINRNDLGNIDLLCPPLPEQQQIASILSNIDTQIQKENLHKSNLEQLKKGLMQKLLTGQIRVKV
jgi:type I restriction enzyme, S subunit